MVDTFKSKVVLVTGASRGIGRACAIRFASKGAKVVITARNQSNLQETLIEMEKVGNNNEMLLIEGDVTDREKTRSLVREVLDRFGKIDVLINNAGDRRGGKRV